jgi:hypothetical protein
MNVHRRDYILRMIEQVGAALAELRRRILGRKDAAEARDALARTAGQAGLDIELLRAFDIPTLQLFAAPGGEVDPTRCWLMAEVLYLDGLEARLSESDDDGRESLLKARSLYDLVRPFGGMLVGMPEAAERIAEIDARLAPPPHDERPGGSVRARRLRARHARAATSSSRPSAAHPHSAGSTGVGSSYQISTS